MIIKAHPDNVEIYIWREDDFDRPSRETVHQVLFEPPSKNFHIAKIKNAQTDKISYKFEIDGYTFYFKDRETAEIYFEYVVNKSEESIQELHPEMFL